MGDGNLSNVYMWDSTLTWPDWLIYDFGVRGFQFQKKCPSIFPVPPPKSLQLVTWHSNPQILSIFQEIGRVGHFGDNPFPFLPILVQGGGGGRELNSKTTTSTEHNETVYSLSLLHPLSLYVSTHYYTLWLIISALLPTYVSVFSSEIAHFLISKLLYPQCSLTLLVSLVTGIFQREANRTVMSCAVLPMRDDLSWRCTMGNYDQKNNEMLFFYPNRHTFKYT